jgi:hypothetical protein
MSVGARQKHARLPSRHTDGNRTANVRLPDTLREALVYENDMDKFSAHITDTTEYFDCTKLT